MNEEWNIIDDNESATEMVKKFEEHNENIINTIVPKKSIKVSTKDNPWMNMNLKKLRRQQQRIYAKEGKSLKYKQIKKEFEDEKRKAAERYKDKILDDLKEGRIHNSYKSLRKLGDGEAVEREDIILQEHIDNHLSPEEAAEDVAAHFAEISNKCKPLVVSELPKEVKDTLNNYSTEW